MEGAVITIVITIDKNFIQHACVMLASVFKNNTSNNVFEIIVVYDGQFNDLKKFQKFIQTNGHIFIFQHIDKTKVNKFKISHHISGATYYRLFMPDMLNRVKKAIYLDSDLIVTGNILELWQTDIGKHIIGAVYPNEKQHFNGGVLIIDFEKWRQNCISDKLINWLNENKEIVQFWDQDALNAVLNKFTYSLQKKWNQDKLINSDGIIHFMGVHKPWSLHYKKNKNKKMYYRMLFKTPYWKFKYVKYLV